MFLVFLEISGAILRLFTSFRERLESRSGIARLLLVMSSVMVTGVSSVILRFAEKFSFLEAFLGAFVSRGLNFLDLSR